jgi:hypothetical protein
VGAGGGHREEDPIGCPVPLDVPDPGKVATSDPWLVRPSSQVWRGRFQRPQPMEFLARTWHEIDPVGSPPT